MSASAEQPERLAEILREIIALSDQTRTSLPEAAKENNNGTELFDAQGVDEIDEKAVSRGKEVRRE